MTEKQPLIPQLGFGTYGRRGRDGVHAICTAIETGYQHIDTAQDYENEAEVGTAVRESGARRDALFITTKIAPRYFGNGALVPSLQTSLEKAKLDVFDLTLIHWPSPNNEVPLEVYLTQLATAQERGMTRLIGVSNFPIAMLEESARILGPGKIVNNQVELNPFMQNKNLASYCSKMGIIITCYLPIAKGRLSTDTILTGIAEAHNATVEQVALAFEMAKGYCAIPTSSKDERIRSNYRAVDIHLTPDEMATIETLDRKERIIDPPSAPEWDA